jgi:hypothetical protein
MLTFLRISVVALALAALTGAGRAAEDDGAAHRPGRAAAHAALTDGADLPANPPSLPELALDGARHTPDPAGLGKKPESARQAASEADQHANSNALTSRDEQANRIAQSSLAATVRSAANDAHVAAAQAQSNTAKAKGAAHGMGPPRPTQKLHP